MVRLLNLGFIKGFGFSRDATWREERGKQSLTNLRDNVLQQNSKVTRRES